MLKFWLLLKRFFYRWLIDATISRIDFHDMYNVLNEYDKFTTYSGKSGTYSFTSDTLMAFRNENGMDAFYKNVHIHTNWTPFDNLTSITIKKENDSWVCTRKGEDIDFTNPTNETMEVFWWIDGFFKGRLNVNSCCYIKGSWNEYFYKTLSKIFSIVKSYTTVSKFNQEYNGIINRKKILTENVDIQ